MRERKRPHVSTIHAAFAYVLTLGLHSVSLFKSKKKVSSDHDHMRHQYRVWVEHLSRYVDVYLPASNAYTLLHTGSLVGLFTCIFVKGSLKNRITNFSTAVVKCGMGGLHGNKVSISVFFIILVVS